jgi:hypothetical protein
MGRYAQTNVQTVPLHALFQPAALDSCSGQERNAGVAIAR